MSTRDGRGGPKPDTQTREVLPGNPPEAGRTSAGSRRTSLDTRLTRPPPSYFQWGLPCVAASSWQHCTRLGEGPAARPVVNPAPQAEAPGQRGRVARRGSPGTG